MVDLLPQRISNRDSRLIDPTVIFLVSIWRASSSTVNFWSILTASGNAVSNFFLNCFASWDCPEDSSHRSTRNHPRGELHVS
jgi:hypothetical protein